MFPSTAGILAETHLVALVLSAKLSTTTPSASAPLGSRATPWWPARMLDASMTMNASKTKFVTRFEVNAPLSAWGGHVLRAPPAQPPTTGKSAAATRLSREMAACIALKVRFFFKKNLN